MSLRVLIADDHEMTRRGLRLVLEAAGMAVVAEAADGREAVRKALEARPDVAVMDLSMPGLNGVDAAARLGARAPGVRIVILSMHASSEHVHRALEAGVIGYVLKESAAAEAVAAVRAASLGRRYLSPALEAVGVATAEGPITRLSRREREVLQLVVEGHTSAEIAALVHLSPKTVETYRARIMQKLDVEDLPALVKFAIAHGLTPPG